MRELDQERLLDELAPDVPASFHQAVMKGLNRVTEKKTRLPVRRAALLAAALALLLGTVAYAARHWELFDALRFMTGNVPVQADSVMRHDLHTETVNGVEISIREAGYDGRTLFIRYSYRMPDVERSLAVYRNGELSEGMREEDLALLDAHGVGWWVDHFWIDGKAMDMAASSGSVISGSGIPGEIIQTEYWRLDNLDIHLTGKVEIALPIGERQPLSHYSPQKEHPEKYDEEGNMLLPEKGVVKFTLDTGDTLSQVRTEHPRAATVLPEVTASVSEVSYTPLMTYITLELKGSEDALAAYKAAHGEGYMNEAGEVIWPYEYMDTFGRWISELELVDGSGALLFPERTYGCNGYSNTWAEFLYPYLEALPGELYLAPVTDGRADMDRAVKVR